MLSCGDRRAEVRARPRWIVLGQVAVDATVAGKASEIDQFSPLHDTLGPASTSPV